MFAKFQLSQSTGLGASCACPSKRTDIDFFLCRTLTTAPAAGSFVVL
jgi:hypothetical protein